MILGSVLWGLMKAVHVFVCIFLILIILIQRGDSGGLGGAFGASGGGDSAFGVKTESTWKKSTIVLASLFIILSIVLGFESGGQQAAAANLEDDTGQPAPTAPESP